jgi:hypothetical protein
MTKATNRRIGAQKTDTTKAATITGSSLLQRKCGCADSKTPRRGCSACGDRNGASVAVARSAGHEFSQVRIHSPEATTSSGEPGITALQPNANGLPDDIRTGLEQISGLNLGGVRVQYNSTEPARLNSTAFAQGANIMVGPGQEKHLPHEGWHIVQQMQGRVKPTIAERGSLINDEESLEREADIMGARALSFSAAPTSETWRPFW